MNKNKFLWIVCIGLLLSNILLIGFILMKKPLHRRGGGPGKIIIERLNFDENQTKKFRKLIHEHQAGMKESREKIFRAKNALYHSLTEESKQQTKDSLIGIISEGQKKIENLHYNHFLDIKNLCREDQMDNFEKLSSELAHLFSPKPGPGRRP